MNEDAKSGLASIPGYFYDAIVYYSSFLTFFFICLFIFLGQDKLKTITDNTNVFFWIIISILTISFGYIWGQLSSALSYHFIKRPTNFLVKKFKSKYSKDYFFEFDEVVKIIDTKNILNNKTKKNYWTIIYYISISNPIIGDDLLKRYARCKLARVNAFNFFILLIFGVIALLISYSISYISILLYLILCIIFIIVFFWEFYQRQCWFGDLVIKTLSAVLAHQK